MLLLINYKLRALGKDYTSFFSVIKSADLWWNYLDSTWIIKTKDNVSSWSDKLHQEMMPGDHLFVVDITDKPRNGWLPKDAWEWLKKNDDKIKPPHVG